ncbi:unnamed protein product [Vicia faba]|uniref:RING-type domain-containing protein n=1 Tax=Vicia faba TaxID=3906 RepID=A0AAV1A2X6_VICFA|nr:unnamed protein product [Vicia faba]
MGLQNQLNDVSSDSIPLLVLMHIATVVNYIRTMLLTLFQSIGLSRLQTDQIVDDHFLAAVGSGLAGIILLSDQLSLNNQHFYTYQDAASADNHRCVFCQSTFENGDHVRKLPCRHVFHRHCLNGWFHRYNFNCPLCRSSLVSDERVALTERRVGSQLISWFTLR